ncbi:MAG: hypothetical protein O7D86_00645 [Proteobacteria bacterium]|nr:hypothetical protein [Pseudomonadota bacterium]
MTEKNVSDGYPKGGDKFERGITHNLTIIKQCLNHMAYELTGDITDKASTELQHERDSQEKYSRSFKKKYVARLVEKSLILFSEFESNIEPVSDKEKGDKGIVDTQTGSPVTKQALFRASLVNLMVLSLQYWQKSTRKN